MCVCVAVSSSPPPPAGWSTDSLQEWGSFMRLAIPSTLMTCFEWWIYESGGFLAGKHSRNTLDTDNKDTIVHIAIVNNTNVAYFV